MCRLYVHSCIEAAQFVKSDNGDVYETAIKRVFAIMKQAKETCDISLDDVVKEGTDKVDIEAIIGNPPYQIKIDGTSDRPVYNDFMDMAYGISSYVILITPACFLFNAGKTPKAWNKKMLHDEHLKVCYYKKNRNDVFQNIEISGGIAITLHDSNSDFDQIGDVYCPFSELDSILDKVNCRADVFVSITGIIGGCTRFNLDNLYRDFPSCKDDIGSNRRERRIVSNAFEKLDVFHDSKVDDDDVEVIGRIDRRRVSKWIRSGYVEQNAAYDCYKIIVPMAFALPSLWPPFIAGPSVSCTQTFLTFGRFESSSEAEACLKYLKTRFVRTLLSILKVTQHNTKEKWQFIPIQDFSESSDIDWTKDVADIDKQLYTKYSLLDTEINFIETNMPQIG